VSDPVLLRADSLMEYDPDSALRLLQRIDQPQKMRKAERASYALLFTQAQDKNYIEHTSDSLIRTAFDYYQQHGTTRQKMEAWYYLASVYRDLGDASRAIDYFRQAAEVTKNKTEHVLLSRIYIQMGTLFFYQKLPKEGIKAYRKAYDYALSANDSLQLATGSIAMARTYTELNKADSALYYYKEAADVARQIGHVKLEEAARLELAGIYLQLDEVEEARRLLAHAEKSGVNYLILGEFYEKSGKTDSARYAYLKALEASDLYVKQGANENLYQLAKSDGRGKETIYYLEQSILYKDSIQKITDTEGVKRIESLYAYQHIANENNRLLLTNKYKERIIFLVCIAFFAAILVFGYVWKRMKDKREHIARLNHLEKQEYQKKIAGYNNEIELLKQQLDQLSADNRQEKERMKERLDKTIEEKNKMIASRQEAEAAFRTSAIYRRVHNFKTEMKDEHWLELQREIDKTYNDFTIRLYMLYPELKQHELRVCLLVKARVTNSGIAALLCLEANSISSMRARLFEKIHHRKGKAKDFDDFIWEL
jgi:tetratricopeptide (TPR) repeat protein